MKQVYEYLCGEAVKMSVRCVVEEQFNIQWRGNVLSSRLPYSTFVHCEGDSYMTIIIMMVWFFNLCICTDGSAECAECCGAAACIEILWM